MPQPSLSGALAAPGPAAARLVRMLAGGQDVLAVLDNEARAEAVARTAQGLTAGTVLHLPPSDVLPGDAAPTSPAVAGKRAAVLCALGEPRRGPLLLVTDITAASVKLAPAAKYGEGALRLAPGERMSPDALASALEAIGYWIDDRVDEPGEFAIRSAAADVFPADAEQPVRLLLEGEVIAALTHYDPVTQLGTGDALERLRLPPAAEPVMQGDGSSLFDGLPDARIVLDPDIDRQRERFLELAKAEAAMAGLLDASAWIAALAGRTITTLESEEEPGRRFAQDKRPARTLVQEIRAAQEADARVLLMGGARDLRFLTRDAEKRLGAPFTRATTLAEVEAGPPGSLFEIEGGLDGGWREPDLLVIAAADVLGARAERADAPAILTPAFGEHAVDLRSGDAVIHEAYGLGMLVGLADVDGPAGGAEAIRLEHSGGAGRLVPGEEAHRLWRYGGEAEGLTLDKLDGSSWEKRRAEIDAVIAQTARELIRLADARAEATAPVLEPPPADYERFTSGFRFTPTPDQARAFAAARDDLSSGRPMNRLIVGDVGYGKTEVALRAAALAVLAGKQAAVVAPTTVLVRQHLELFTRRFAPFGIEVVNLSRLSTPAEARKVRERLKSGEVRVVVGTTALAGKQVDFADLGLVVIDEEQRFGAADKAKLAALGEGVHVLSMTATPIPRTLQAALVGLQDLSVIATPPARRRPTRTQVAAWSDEAVRSALRREKARGGQSFVVVPRIEDMAPLAEMLGRLVPELHVRQAHGKMPVAESDEALVRFADGDGDVLLATNIIEAGLDIPRANTMAVMHADRFGLAQLHQLRGRVGRGRVRGVMLLMTDPGTEISPKTTKRLAAMAALDQLGAGFAVAARDLDLRGAGDILGEEQAGHMKLIGLGLYQHLLELAIRQARGEKIEDWTPEIHGLGTGGFPIDWVPEEEVRLNLYVRLARLADPDAVEAFGAELEDRFGTLPAPAQTLLDAARLRQLARGAGVARVDAGPAAIALTPRPGHEVDGDRAGLIRSGERWVLKEALPDEAVRRERLVDVLEDLAEA